jgi:hypothetical protein
VNDAERCQLSLSASELVDSLGPRRVVDALGRAVEAIRCAHHGESRFLPTRAGRDLARHAVVMRDFVE